MHIDAQNPAYYPSKHLNNDARDYESIQQDINAIVAAQNTYRLFWTNKNKKLTQKK